MIIRTMNRAVMVALCGLSLSSQAVLADDDTISIIHIGDVHGDLHPHTNTRSDNTDQDLEGGLARIKTVVDKLRRKARNRDHSSYTFMTGDTTHGSAQATYTHGDAMLKVLNEFSIDVFAPGNWDFVFGTCRTHEMWGFKPAALAQLKSLPNNGIDCSTMNPPGELAANWKTISANVYVDADDDGQSGSCQAATRGERLFDPYTVIKDKKTGLKIGVIGFTTERGPRVIGNSVVKGLCFTKGDTATLPPYEWFDHSPTPIDHGDASEIFEMARAMHNEKVDLVVMLSELGLANNIRLVDLVNEAIDNGEPGLRKVDLVLSADMHEETPKILYSVYGTAVVAQGQDGENIGELELNFDDKKLDRIKFKSHPIESNIKEDRKIARLIEDIEASFETGPDFNPDLTEPLSGQNRPLAEPLDTELGIAGQDFNRNNFSHETDKLAATFEGSGHNLITDAFRVMVTDILDELEANSTPGNCLLPDGFHNGDCKHYKTVGIIRGFRYATSIREGEPITRDALFHYIPISPFVSVGRVPCGRLRNIVKNSGVGSLSANVRNWGGGWLFNWSGLSFDLNPYIADSRLPTFNPANPVGGNNRPNPPDPTPGLDRASNFKVLGEPLVPSDQCLMVGYNYDEEPDRVNKIDTRNTHRVVMEQDKLALLDLQVNDAIDLSNSKFSGCTLSDTPCDTSKSVLAVDVVAKYIKEKFGANDQVVSLLAPAQRMNITCPLPDMADVKNTKNAVVLNPYFADFALYDIGFSLEQSIVGANPNLIQFLPGTIDEITAKYPACLDAITQEVCEQPDGVCTN